MYLIGDGISHTDTDCREISFLFVLHRPQTRKGKDAEQGVDRQVCYLSDDERDGIVHYPGVVLVSEGAKVGEDVFFDEVHYL